jgi:RNA polymerase sigma-70 factor (ECF subfamily)
MYAGSECMAPSRETALELPLLGRTETALTGFEPAAEDEVVLLFDELRSPLLRYTVSLGVNVSDGEDLIQEAFLSLFRHLRLGRGRSNLRGWLFRVAHNLALKHRNHRQRVAASLSARVVLENQPTKGTNPEEDLGDRQRQEMLLAVVRALPEQDQNCLRLRAEGLRYREIAQVLGISLGAVSNSLVRSFERLNRVDPR